MRLRQYAVVVPLGIALASAGLSPVEHVHRAEPTRRTVVHAHLDLTTPHDGADASAVHDEHDAAVMLDRVMAGGSAPRGAEPPALLSRPFAAILVSASDPLPADLQVVPTPSPPPKPSAPRAPPA